MPYQSHAISFYVSMIEPILLSLVVAMGHAYIKENDGLVIGHIDLLQVHNSRLFVSTP